MPRIVVEKAAACAEEQSFLKHKISWKQFENVKPNNSRLGYQVNKLKNLDQKHQKQRNRFGKKN